MHELKNSITIISPCFKQKNSEHFQQPTNGSLIESIASRSYILNESKIITTYHCEHEVLQRREVYCKDDTTKAGSDELVILQNAAISAVKSLATEIAAFRESSYRKERNCSEALTFHLDEVAFSPSGPTEGGADERKENDIDYLSPYLLQIDNQAALLSKEEQILVRDACLRGMRERLLERANIMQSKLDLARRELSQKQEAYQGMKIRSLDSKQKFEQMCAGATFKIKVLEKRLIRHEDAAIQKYKVRLY